MSRFFAAAEKAKSAPVEELEMKTPEEWAAARQKEKMLQLVQMLRGKGGYDICFAEWQANGFDPDRVPVLPYVSFEVQIYSFRIILN